MKRSRNHAATTDAEANQATDDSESVSSDASASVAWHDLSAKSSTSELPSPTTEPATVSHATATNTPQSQPGVPLTIETDLLTATLVDLSKLSIADLTHSPHRDVGANSAAIRHCATIDVENTSDVPIHWLTRQTRFIGSDDHTYGQAHLPLTSTELAPGCHTTHVVIDPRCKARVITPIEQLPQGVEVTTVAHTLTLKGHTAPRRLRFTL